MRRSTEEESHDPYAIESILRACRLVAAFRFEGETLSLRELVARTGINKATAFRALHSMVIGGLLERVGRDQYRPRRCANPRSRLRFGYGAMTSKSVFSRDVTDGLRRATALRGIELVEFDNQYSATIALRNAERIVRERVDIAIEAQIHQEVAAKISATFSGAGIPLIAVDIPHPGATFFGGNNHVAGRIGGRALAQWAKRHWSGKVDGIILLKNLSAGALAQSRLTGVVIGIRKLLPGAENFRMIELDGRGGYVESMDVVRKFLRNGSKGRFLVGAINDPSALGAVHAFEEAGRLDDCAAMGQNATMAVRAALRKPGSRLIGSVAFFPETYGDYLVPLALDILRHTPVPPSLFVKHVLITPENVDEHYPNDTLEDAPTNDALLAFYYH